MTADWNLRTAVHRQAIEKIKPGLIDTAHGKVTEITNCYAHTIYSSKPGTPEWELRFHFIELLNYFEFVATAYENGVADKKMIEVGFKAVLVRWHKVLTNFIDTVAKSRGYRPEELWTPYQALVKRWIAEDVPPPRTYTDALRAH
jgi:hypothetical protein